MEFKKFSARNIKADFPITAIRMHKVLCQDILFDLNSKFTEIDSFKFSSAFFYDFNMISVGVNWDKVFVIDGVEFLHRYSGSTKPLVRDRALYAFLYLPDSNASTFAEAMITNPWLNNLCNRPLRLLSERVSAVKSTISRVSSSIVYNSIVQAKSLQGFTPRGVWGLDYMFMWKSHHLEPELKITETVSLITLADYVKSFK